MGFDAGPDDCYPCGLTSVEVLVAVLWGRTRTEYLPDGVCCCGWTEVDSLVLEYLVGTLEIDSAYLAESLMAIASAYFPGTLIAVDLAYLAAIPAVVDVACLAELMIAAESACYPGP
jgi:hypothetical protein